MNTNLKRITIGLSLLILLILAGIYTNLISFGGLCGWKDGALVKNRGKNWPCNCIGIILNASTSYSEKTYCTGLNLSYNKFLNLPINTSQQVPRYAEKAAIRTLEVTVINLASKKPIEYGTVVVYDSDNKQIKKSGIKKDGRAVFMLPQGTYTLKMAGGYTGKETVEVRSNMSVELVVLQILN